MPTAQTTAHVARRGAGFPVVIIHGYAVDHRMMLPLDDALGAAGPVERIYLDLAGFGQTPALEGRGGLKELSAWLDGEVHALIGERPFALLAHSLGGLLARAVQANSVEQVRGLALIAPVVDPIKQHRRLPGFDIIERDDALLATLSGPDAEAFTETTARQTRQTWSRFEQFSVPGMHAADEDAMARLTDSYETDAAEAMAEQEVNGPVLVITGRQDDVVGYEDQHDLAGRAYRDATVATLAGAGHNIHLDDLATTSALLTRWMQDVLRLR